MQYDLDIQLNSVQSHIVIRNGLFETLGVRLREHYPDKRFLVVSDERVYTIYGPRLEQQIQQSGSERAVIILPAGEDCKTGESLYEIYRELLAHQFTRDDVILAFGGGSIGDVAGLAAATYLRGMNFVQLPTTLTAQADSCLGGKNGVNIPAGKNLIGTFYHPHYVWIDPQFLNTLDDPILAGGMAEIIKFACIESQDFFDMLLMTGQIRDPDLLPAILYRCSKIKKHYVEEDEYEQNVRMKLNFGHTLGHGVERYYDYRRFSHGEAVAMGMYTITCRAEQMGLTRINTSAMLREILEQFELPWALPDDIDKPRLVDIMLHDKKHRGNQIHLVLLDRIGRAYIHTAENSRLTEFV